MTERKHRKIDAGERAYSQWRSNLLGDPKARELYEREARKKDLWLQLVEARRDAGLTQAELASRLGVSQAQVARVEKRGYDAYALSTLRRYVAALGEGWELDVRIRHTRPGPRVAQA